jgi:hypothetical protein
MVPLTNKGGKLAIVFLENNMDLVFVSIITSNDIPTLSRMEYNKQPLKI